jgi:hypothetical protein
MKTNIVFLLFILLGIQSCITTRCAIHPDFENNRNSTIRINDDYDPINLKKTISQEANKLGFKRESNDDSSKSFLSYSYIHYFDVFHYTLNVFSVLIVDRQTSQVLAAASCTGDGPAGAKGIVKSTFSTIAYKADSLKRK